ncbi:unnamed protein product, partial [marine sediment metagenome]
FSIMVGIKFKTLGQLMLRYESEGRESFQFDNIDDEFFKRFKEFVRQESNASIVESYIALDEIGDRYVNALKSFMKWSYEKGFHTNDSYKAN